MTDFDTRKLPGLKAREIGKTITRQGVADQGPVFYRVTVEQYVLDANAIRRQSGLEMMLGSPALAGVMGPDEDIAKLIQKCTGFVGGADAAHMPILSLLAGEDDDSGEAP